MKVPDHCFECNVGRYEVVSREYEYRDVNGISFLVPDVKFLKCNQCGDEIVPKETDILIKNYVASENEQLTKAELYSILEKLGRNQKDFAEAVGLGEKTLHRWLKGTQVVSRSIGFYLRAIAEFPEVFQWIEQRNWRRKINRSTSEINVSKVRNIRFAALNSGGWKFADRKKNPARGLVEVNLNKSIR